MASCKRTSAVFLVALALGAAALMPGLAHAEPDYVEGIEYQRIEPTQPTRVPEGQVEVVELFWYGCPHCNRFEPKLRRWLQEDKPDYVTFVRIPAQLNPGWEVHAAAYFTAQILGVEKKMHQPLFDAIHKEGRDLRTPEALADFFAEHGVDRERFLQTYHSFAVRARMDHARRLVHAYGADSVPTIVINGKYRTDANLAGGTFNALLELMNFLVRKEHNAEGA